MRLAQPNDHSDVSVAESGLENGPKETHGGGDDVITTKTGSAFLSWEVRPLFETASVNKAVQSIDENAMPTSSPQLIKIS